MSDKRRFVLGIDLGTTNSCVAVYLNDHVEILRNKHDKGLTPSVVAFSEHSRLVGDEAKDQLAWNDNNTVYGVKRLIGRNFNDPNIQGDLKHWPFEVISDGGKPKIKVKHQDEDKTFHPQEISAMILKDLKQTASDYLGLEVTDVVITVPAYFDNNQRQATRAAGRIAGLNVLRLINEPTAAALAYGLEKTDRHNIMVYDLGGGTFDVSILNMKKGMFEVKATKGNTHLGGEDFDNRMVNYFAKQIKKDHKIDVFSDKGALRRLKYGCEKVKIQLSSFSTVRLDLFNLVKDVDFELVMNRHQFEEINEDLFQSTITTVEEALTDCNMTIKDIHDVVLVGGSTRIPRIQLLLKTLFQKQALKRDINPDEAVARGAAVQGALLSQDRPFNLEGMELYDVVPLSLGTDLIGGKMSVIIPKNTQIPAKKRQSYNTTRENQTDMLVQVYEGERALVKDNIYLGETVLKGIQPDARGYAKIDVIFEIDDDCILHVKARDRDTATEQNLQIFNNCKKLDEKEMERLIAEAEANRAADDLSRQRIDALNNLDFYMKDIRATCCANELKMSVSQRNMIFSKLDSIRQWIGENDKMEIEVCDCEAKRVELEQIWNPIITQVINMSRKASAPGKPVFYMGGS